jgi:uncharacterized membrane protein YraQ (UPF0718 family)/copper chaperone CopZ
MLEELKIVWLSFTPWLLLGTIIASLLHLFVPEQWIKQQLGAKAGVWKAVLFGVPLPLCSCGVIPTGLGLRKNGASLGATVGFLISTPQTGIDSILVTSAFLGWPFAIAKVLIATFTGLLGGYLVQALVKEEEIQSCDIDPHQDHPHQDHPHRSFQDFVDFSLELLYPIWLWIVIGVFASASISHWLPADQVQSWFGANSSSPLWGMLISLVISLPLYVCATASIPIAGALISKGFGIGSALVFLLAGPASNMATMGAIYQGLGKKVLTIYLSVLVLSSLAFGWFLEKVIVLKPLSSHAHHHLHHHFSAWEYLCAIIVFMIFSYFAYQSIIRWLNQRKFKENENNQCELDHEHHDERSREVMMSDKQTQIIAVKGMTCMGCANRLEKVLKKVNGVNNVVVSLNPDQAYIEGNAKTEDIIQSIELAGFEAPSAQPK